MTIFYCESEIQAIALSKKTKRSLNSTVQNVMQTEKCPKYKVIIKTENISLFFSFAFSHYSKS
jgi:hypothetical protein